MLLWARFEELVVVNGILCLAEKSEMTSSSRIIPPRQLRQEIFIKYHAKALVEDITALKKLSSSTKNNFIGRA